MKAIILAGGEGTRLRPLSEQLPKPMMPLFDRPVLWHSLQSLKNQGIEEACLTLGFLPDTITTYFGTGEDLGMKLHYQLEETPLGTAGGARLASDFFGEELVLVLSGDAVCDFDFSAAIAYHKEKKADATILLYAHEEPLEYGLVMTDEEGCVTRFIEKPPWKQVFTNRINTGIYILSPKAMQEIPKGQIYDFSKDLFPKMLEKGMNLYAYEAKGYWCDIGSPSAYLQCARDALSGKLNLQLGEKQEDIYTKSPIPAGVTIGAPVYVGVGVTIEKGAQIGPFSMIGANSVIKANAQVRHSMVNGAYIGEGAKLKQAVVDTGAVVQKEVVISEGGIIGANTILGEGSFVEENIRIWANKEVAPYTKVRENMVSGRGRKHLRFSGGSRMIGEWGFEINPETAVSLGGVLGTAGRVGIGFSGEQASHLIARNLACGVIAAGGQAYELEGGFESFVAYAADLYGLDYAVFVRFHEPMLQLKIFGKRGLLLNREEERKIEAALQLGEKSYVKANKIGSLEKTAGTQEAYIRAASLWGDLGDKPQFPVSVAGGGMANRALRQAFLRMGATLEDAWDVAEFETARGGMTLRAKDEEGNILDTEKLLGILVMLELESGKKAVALPYSAPKSLDQLAERFSANILRLGRDPGAAGLYYRSPYLRDGVFAACRLVGAMAVGGETLHELAKRGPQIYIQKEEVAIEKGRAQLMQELTAKFGKEETELIEGLRLPVKDGFLHVKPSATRPVLQVVGEGVNMEAAREICADLVDEIRRLDS